MSAPAQAATVRGALTADYDFELPPERIAQVPAADRAASRLLVVHRDSGAIEHRTFRDLAEMIPAGDVLVVNRSRVIRARLLGTRDSGAAAEVFLLRQLDESRFEAMVHPGGKLRPGRTVHVAPDLDIDVLETTPRRTRIVRLRTTVPVREAIDRHGHVPLPPYIVRGDAAEDSERYQTVYADEPGSVAAPTAGLHFTPELLAGLERRGVRRADVVLHVGAGTFKPVEAADPAAHVMHEEWCQLPAASARTLNDARAGGGRVWAVGTTSVRVLESALGAGQEFSGQEGETRIFIRPPYAFRAVDKLITNFHLPRSTLLMLVAAFAGYDLTMHAYAEAIHAGYRFYSYGDAMAVV